MLKNIGGRENDLIVTRSGRPVHPSRLTALFEFECDKAVRRYRVIGSQGYVDLDPAFSYAGLEIRVADRQGPKKLTLAPVNHFAAEMDHFSTCVKDDKEPKTPGEEGLRDLQVIQAIYEAGRTGQAVRLQPTVRAKADG